MLTSYISWKLLIFLHVHQVSLTALKLYFSFLVNTGGSKSSKSKWNKLEAFLSFLVVIMYSGFTCHLNKLRTPSPTDTSESKCVRVATGEKAQKAVWGYSGEPFSATFSLAAYFSNVLNCHSVFFYILHCDIRASGALSCFLLALRMHVSVCITLTGEC